MIRTFRGSISAKAGFAAAALACGVALGAAFLSYGVARDQLAQMHRKELETRISVVTTHLGNEMRNLVGALSEMAGNTLFSNALADSGGRDHYLRPYLESFQQVGSIPVRVTLSDFQGRPLAANLSGPAAEPDVDALRRAVDTGDPQARIVPTGRTVMFSLAWPVLYPNTGLPEGAISFQFDFKSLTRDVFDNDQEGDFRIRFSGGEGETPVEFLEGSPPPAGAMMHRTVLPTPAAFDKWTISAEVWDDPARMAQALKQLRTGYLIIDLVGLLLIVPVSLIGARRLLARLKALESTARRVVDSHSLEQRFPDKGNDEIAHLGRAFNHMLNDLNRAYETLKSTAHLEMKRQSERFRRILSATLEGYVRIDMNTRIIEEVNEAFCRMTERECELWEGRPVPDFLDDLLAPAQSTRSRKAWTEEREIEWPNGAKVSLLIHCSLDIDDGGNRQLVAFMTDVTKLKTAEAEVRSVNNRLVRSISAMEQRDRELTLLNRMNDLLLACRKSEEAFEVVRLTADGLFPETSGGLAIYRPESGALDMVVRWGDRAIGTSRFNIEDCWAMRQGRVHEATPSGGGLICDHLKGERQCGSMCVPLGLQGKTLGLLWSEMAAGDDAAWEGMRGLVISLGDAIKLAISNLELREALHDQAIRDPLTGLYNRRYFNEIIGRELARARRIGTLLAIASIDLDHFKRINDGFGHDAGDRVLATLARLLLEGIRGSDAAFRFGGEEFVLLMPATDGEGALTCLESLRTRLETMELQHKGQPFGPITLSAGVAIFPVHGETEEALIRASDRALYRAKEGGRNRVAMAEADPTRGDGEE